MNNNSNTDLIMQISNEVIRCDELRALSHEEKCGTWRRIRISKDHVRRRSSW